MSHIFYLNRTLFSDDQKYTEAELLTASNYIVILAEPGAGKTELLKSLAKQVGIKEKTASVFRQVGTNQIETPIVIDAFDELAKIGDSGIHELFANISRANPTQVIISSRSSEWSNSATSTFKDFIGHTPLIARLCEFDDSEQHAIFTHHTKKDNFLAFKTEVTRFALEPLLPNPQFLKLFADAYIESNGHFVDKRSIFTQAIAHLAKEVNIKAKPNPALPIDKKIRLSSEIFAKLLLSGAEGIVISESSEDRMYPLVGSLLSSSNIDVSNLLATRLFKPGDNSDQHRPVHKIVAEYCAADYLIKRIANPSDPLTIAQCLSVVAPNSVVRDELRGLLGWMAALGHKPIQEAALELDPYAVLANGDPSQLEPSSKRLLLFRLRNVEAEDPYFRRGDFRRRFSVAGFFTQDVVEDIKSIITNRSDGHLRDLLLELLVGAQAVKWLVAELHQLVLEPSESKHSRVLAKNCLLELDGYDFRLDLNFLIVESSNSSLNMAADAIKTLGLETFKPEELKVFFQNCVSLYTYKKRFDSTIGTRYFIKNLIGCLSLDVIEWLLDSLSKGLVCRCGKKEYECDCRIGISKIIGSLLDRYFVLASPPFEPLRIWLWVQNLHFPDQKNTRDVTSVRLLQRDDALRQGIIAHVFGELTNREQIFDIIYGKFGSYYSHTGLHLQTKDYKFIVDLAFENENPSLWGNFIPKYNHSRNKDDRGPDYLFRHMRGQALDKPEFMREWAKSIRTVSQHRRQDIQRNYKHRRSMKRRDEREHNIRLGNIEYIKANLELVESGRDWSSLVRFAELVLENRENIEQEFGDEKVVRNALKNCINFIEPQVPNLKKLAELQCASKGLLVETILFAACLEIMRFNGNLVGIKHSLLVALRTNLSMGYSDVDEDERDALKAEIDRLIFPNLESAEQFLREYIEPQLAVHDCVHPEVSLLKYEEIFSPLRAKLSIEWLGRFRNLAISPLDTLFEITAQYGDREELNEIILTRCSEFLSKWPDPTDDVKLEEIRKFWFVRAFYFLNLKEAEPYWDWLKSDRNSLLVLNERSGRMNRGDYPYWSSLTSHKVAAILEAFFDKWPKVHLPSHWGSGDPSEETAYRFLKDIIWHIGNDSPDDAVSVLSRLLAEPRFSDIHTELKSIQAEQLRKKALIDFEPPSPHQIVDLLDNNAVVTVEGLRQLVIQELTSYQKDIDGGEFNDANRFYAKIGKGSYVRLGEVDSVEIIASRLKSVLHPQSITIGSEHQTKNHNRIDITAAKMIDGKRRLLVIEAKGQWHPDLYSAASTQLFERYSIHPDAEQQGIYLVIWFGDHEKVENRKVHGITSAVELRKSIENTLSPQLKGLIDVFVLDVSRT